MKDTIALYIYLTILVLLSIVFINKINIQKRTEKN